MDLGLNGKTAVISGGSKGIGKETARALAREGVDVVIVARTRERLEATAREIAGETGRRIVPITADTSDDDAVKAMARQAGEALGHLDILVNCAAVPGGLRPQPKLPDIKNEHFWEDMNVKVMGYIRTIREVSPYMIERRWGRIVNLSGGAARMAGSVIGSIRNAGVVALSKNFAMELGPHGIGVVTVHPGLTYTEDDGPIRLAAAKKPGMTDEEARSASFENNHLQRTIYAADVANVICFLASPKADPVTGDVVTAGGGVGNAIYY